MLHRFERPVGNGPGGDTTLLLGLRNMSEKSGVLIGERGKEMLVFPGPGGHTVDRSPGTRNSPITPAPTGHLVMPCR